MTEMTPVLTEIQTLAPTALSAEERERVERLVEEFRAYLEDAAQLPEPGDAWDGEPLESPSPAVDLSTLLAEMAVLKNELRLQSRQFKNTLDELRCFGNDLRAHSERLQEDLERAREQAASIQGQTTRQFLLACSTCATACRVAWTPRGDRRHRFSSACFLARRALPPAWPRGSA
jgi:hypothetical protein